MSAGPLPMTPLEGATITVRFEGRAVTMRAGRCRDGRLEVLYPASERQFSAAYWREAVDIAGPERVVLTLLPALDPGPLLTLHDGEDPDAEVRRLREALRSLCDDLGDRLAASYCATSYEAARALLAGHREAP